MKNKLIRSASHNWTHSFMSDTNCVAGAPVYEELYALARQNRPEPVVISWIPVKDHELEALSQNVVTGILAYRHRLDDYLVRNKIEKSAIQEMRTEVYVEDTFRLYVRSYARDIAGKEYVSLVWN